MKNIYRQINKLISNGTNRTNEYAHQEPDGHIHPNYRHWNWFKQSSDRNR